MSRTPSGCKRCRETHQKCVLIPLEKECVRCVDANVACIFEPRTRFKSVSHVPLKGAGAGRGNARFRLSYSRRQKWVDIPRALSFVEEKGDDEEVGQSDELSGAVSDNNNNEQSRITSASDQYIQSVSTDSSRANARPQPAIHLSSPLSTSWQTLAHHAATSAIQLDNSQVPEFPLPHAGNSIDPVSMAAPPGPTSSLYSSAQASPSSQPSQALLLSKREAYLMRNFIEVVSTWLDACDLQRHFATIVPKRAFRSPVLLYAVFASSADHQLQIRKNSDETESIGYHDECLNRLIPALSQQETTIDESILAAVTILRIVEEFSAHDDRCHLLGTTRILNSISSFASSGGLGEACAWLSLRQNSYVAFVNQEPLVPLLTNYEKSRAFRDEDDGSWANRIVFVFAKALTLAFGSENPVRETSWSELKEETEHWFGTKPHSFMPMWMEPVNLPNGRAFPQPWLLGAPQVVALQHYHLTKIMIAAFTPQPQLTGFHSLLKKSNTEDTILKSLRLVIGLSQANKNQLIGFFAASHALSICGFLLRNESERGQAVELLKEMSERIGWRTSLERLERTWSS